MKEKMPSETGQELADVQSYEDTRNLAIDEVGITDVPYPIKFASNNESEETPQSTVGKFDMLVSLPSTSKGTHMSRFIQTLRDHERLLSYESLAELCVKLRHRVTADWASICVNFPYFIERQAPVSAESGLLQLDVTLNATAGKNQDLKVTVAGPAMSLCPCSKEIAEYGAHNQRCLLSASIRFHNIAHSVSVSELFQHMEQAASASVYSTLKRNDEKYVTELSYDNPKFVEDTVRDLALRLKSCDRISWFRCSTKNFESIHQHNAFAQIESKPN